MGVSLVPAPLITFLLVVLFSIIIVRIGTVALTMTGLSREIAAFQAQSAFSGVGGFAGASFLMDGRGSFRKIV